MYINTENRWFTL